MSDKLLDYKGLRCPMPIVKLSQATKTMVSGETVRVEATDAAFRPDLEAWSRRMGFRVAAFSEGEVKSATLEKL